jgi:hypothetical protein
MNRIEEGRVEDNTMKTMLSAISHPTQYLFSTNKSSDIRKPPFSSSASEQNSSVKDSEENSTGDNHSDFRNGFFSIEDKHEDAENKNKIRSSVNHIPQ